MSLYHNFNVLGQLPHFLMAKRTSRRVCSEPILTASPIGILCTYMSERKSKVSTGKFDPSLILILNKFCIIGWPFSRLTRIKLKFMTICMVVPAAREWSCYPLQNWRINWCIWSNKHRNTEKIHTGKMPG